MLFNINELKENIKNLKVVVIGDYSLDQNWYMDAKFDKKLDYNDDITFALTDIVYSPGGAGNVANNFIRLGASVKCIGLIGDDGPGYQLMKCLENSGADSTGMIKTFEKETHTCIRPVRIKEGKNIALNEIITSKFVNTSCQTELLVKNIVRDVVDDVDAFVLVEQFDDNNQGIFTDFIRREIISLSKIHEDKIFIVDSRKYIDQYENMYLKCNKSEFAGISGDLKAYKALFITCGENGIVFTDSSGRTGSADAIKVTQEINTCGAGDSATAGIVTGLYSGYNIKKAAMLGNIMASVTIKNLDSTGYPTYEEIAETVESNQLLDFKKI